MKTMKTIIPTVVLQEVMDAMDDMATDSRLLDMKQSRVHQFDAARDALRAALDNLQCGCEMARKMYVCNSCQFPYADQPPSQCDCLGDETYTEAYLYTHPQPDPTPYLWYDPENGDTWTQEAVDEGFCVTDSLIPLYTK